MQREAIYEKLNALFRDVFDDETITVTDTTTAADIEDWDSLANISLIVAVESEFGIKFSIDEVSDIGNVGELVDVIGLKL